MIQYVSKELAIISLTLDVAPDIQLELITPVIIVISNSLYISLITLNDFNDNSSISSS